ncbi:MAG: long-chain-fatty-acid--CoA ligase [Hyphomicrobiaceae bacterium]|nr:MAG: long-chain-fatty-acid--CoA ligase [Hyphomicrobiaceae bacterium]
MLYGQMMSRPLLISSIIDFAAEVHGAAEIVSSTVEGGIHRYTFRDSRRRIARLANALKAMGIGEGDRVATLAWNGYRHFELYYAISGIGAVCHTINPRLFPDQLTYIVNHAQDRILFFDLTFAPLIAKMQAVWPKGMRYVAMTDRGRLAALEAPKGIFAYEDLLEGESDEIEWADLDENAAAALCYTSGTTGEPKGALYSHRSTVLHAMSKIIGSGEGFRQGKKIMPVVPLFHVNAWGLPYSAPLAGAPILFPGPKLDGASLFDLMDGEEAYSSWGVPTVWLGLLAEMKARGRKPKGFEEVIIGGSAAPLPMIEAFERDWGVRVVHGWGMTEMSPVGTMCRLPPETAKLPFKELMALKARQGRRLFGVEMKIVDEAGRRQPHDGEAVGELFVRGPTIVSSYFANEAASAKALDKEGWFGTGDVARITPDGYLIIVDRTKDLIKSGGEWISSIDVENAALAHPAVASCAVIAMPHPRWTERPLLVVVKKSGAEVTKDEIAGFLAARIAKWQLPDDVAFVDALPLTATGKVSKRNLREQFADYKLPGV